LLSTWTSPQDMVVRAGREIGALWLFHRPPKRAVYRCRSLRFGLSTLAWLPDAASAYLSYRNPLQAARWARERVHCWYSRLKTAPSTLLTQSIHRTLQGWFWL